MNTTKRDHFVIGILAIGAIVFLFCQPESYSKEKTESKKEVLLNQLPDGSIIAVSSRWKNTTTLTTVPFPDLARSSETDIRAVLRPQGVTHLLLTSQDVYPHLSIYSDSVSLVETDEGCTTFRYASRNPLSQTAMLKGPDNQLSGIYLVMEKTPIHFKENLQDNIKIISVVCEFLDKDEILRLPPKEIYFKDRQFLAVEKTCPYTVEVKKLTNNEGLTVDPRWSPDGKTIVYRYEGKEGKSIYTMSANGKNQKPLIPPKAGPILRFSPAWSPDGKRIVFCEMEWLNEKPEVRLIIYNIASKQQKIRHLPRGLQDASWMGADSIIVSAIDDKSDKYDIYRYDIATDTFINLANTPNLNEYNPHWINDNVLDVSVSEKKRTLWGEIKTYP